MLFSLWFLFPCLSIHASASAIPSPVLDTTGNSVLAGARYVILPVLRGFGGGVTTGLAKDNNSCYGDVVQDRFEVSSGTPVVFSPVNGTKGAVKTLTDMYIQFTAIRGVDRCSPSLLWKLGKSSDSKLQYYLTTGGSSNIVSWFKISQNGRDYNLQFCPSVCCNVMCRAVGIYIDKGVRRLALSDTPFRVMFKKVLQ